MRTRTLGRTGIAVGEIGLGTEYLLKADRATMADVLARASEAGVNYIDLLYTEADWWQRFGPAMRPQRQHWVTAVHWGWCNPDEDGEQDACQARFDANLAAMGTDYADLAVIMMVDWQDKWDGWAQAAIERLIKLQAQGRMRHLALSCHKAHMARQAVASGAIDVLMYPVNLAAHCVEGNDALYAECQARGVGLVAMKPYAGGMFFLAEQSVFLHWVQAGGQTLIVEKAAPITPAQCLAYVLDQPVATTVPGVKDLAELDAALAYQTASPAERDYAVVLGQIQHFTMGQCVYCNHCLPCPAGIDIGEALRLADQALRGMTAELRAGYAALPQPASACIQCEACVPRCPYEVPIPGRMHAAAALFE